MLVSHSHPLFQLFANPIRRQPAHADRSDSSLASGMSGRRNGHLANGSEPRTPGGRGFGRGEGGAFGGGVSTSRYTPSGAGGGSDYITAGHEERRAAGGVSATERTPWTPGGRSRDSSAAAEPVYGAGRGERSALTGERRNLRGTVRRDVPEAGALLA